jgi:c-di-GMP-binding flagellar brake protein YcgR
MKNGNQLRKHSNIKALLSILNNCKLSNIEMMMWRIVGKNKIVAIVKLKIIRKSREEILIVPSMETMSDFESIISGVDKVNIFIPEYGVLFQSKLKLYDLDKVLTIKIPTEYAQINRRKHIRLGIENLDVSFFINTGFKKKISKGCVDISVGGLAFYASKAEAILLFKNLKVKDMKFNFEGINFQLDGIVVNQLEVSPMDDPNILYKCWKISFEFQNVRRGDAEKLGRLIYSKLSTEDMSNFS